jgi:hypothetical protein
MEFVRQPQKRGQHRGDNGRIFRRFRELGIDPAAPDLPMDLRTEFNTAIVAITALILSNTADLLPGQ